MPKAVFQSAEHPHSRITRSSIRLLVGLQVLLAILVLAGVFMVSEHLRNVTLENIQSHSAVQNHNLNDRLTHSLDLLQLHLRTLISDNPEVAIDVDALREVLNGLQAKLNYIRSISVVDVGSKIFLSTLPENEGLKIDLGHLQPRGGPGNLDLLRFAAPWQGRSFVDGTPFAEDTSATLHTRDSGFFPVTLALKEAPQWNFLIALNSDYFINHVPEYSEPTDLTYRVMLNDGTLLFSTSVLDRPGSIFLNENQLHDIFDEHVGSTHWADRQGLAGLVSFRTANRYPWFTYSRVSVESALKKWQRNTRQLWSMSLALLTALLLLSGFMTRRVARALRQEETLQEKNRLAATVFIHSNDLIVITNSARQCIAINPAFETVTGFIAGEVLGRIPGALRNDPDSDHAGADIWEALTRKDYWQGEAVEQHKNGHLIDGWLQVNVIRGATGAITNYVCVFKDLSDLRASEASVRKLSQAVEQSPSSIVMTDLDAAIEYANPQFLRATGYTKAEVMGANPRILQSGLTPTHVYTELWEKITSGQVWHGEFINRSKTGVIYHERSSISPVLDDKGQITGYLAIKHDITKERQAERSLLLSASIIENAPYGVFICDADEIIIEVNPAFTKITGYSASEAVGQHPGFLSDTDSNMDVEQNMRQTLQSQDLWQGEFYNRHKEGWAYVMFASISTIRDHTGQVTSYICIVSDITERKAQQEHLQQLAHFDPLTGLANRSLLKDRLEMALSLARRQLRWLAVCFLDLDGFKDINDIHGHAAGDELLVIIGQRLKDAVRGSDTVARLGGDEFVLLLGLDSGSHEYERVLQRILKDVAEPVQLDNGHLVQVTGSMGVTLYPVDDSSAEQLLKHADHAMYQAKAGGRNRYVLSDQARRPD